MIVSSKKKVKLPTDETSETPPVVPEWQRRRPVPKNTKANGARFSPINAAEGDSAAPNFPENNIP